MPATPYKRVQIVTVPRVYTVLRRISDVTGQPLGGIVRQMLEEGLPALEAMAEALESIPSSPVEALSRMARTVDQVGADVRQMGLELEGERDTLVKRVARQAKRKAAQKAARE